MTAKRSYPEWELQKTTASFLAYALRRDAIAFHPANEQASSIQRRLLAAGGLRPGVADWVIFHAGQAYCVELKANRNALSGAQERFRTDCGSAGVPYAVCRSLEAFAEILGGWDLLKPGVAV